MVSSSSGLSAAADATSAAAVLKPAVPAYLVPADLPEALRELIAQGEFSRAEAAIEQRLKDDPAAASGLTRELERLRRLRRDYSLSEERLRAKLRRSLPQATDVDFARWRDAGAFQSLVIDGQVRYFGREPSNLLLFHPEARAMKEAAEAREKEKDATTTASAPAGDPSGRSTEKFDTEDYIRRVLAAARDSGTTQVFPVRFRVRHRITVEADAVPAGTLVRCWMPLAAPYRHQGGAEELKTMPAPSTAAPPDAPQRTVYMEQAAQAGKPTVFEARWSYRSAAYIPLVDPDRVRPADPDDPALRPYLEERPPHVAVTPDLHRLALDLAGTTETNPWRKAERIYSWVQKNIRWCAEMEYSVMPRITEKVFTERRGDCGTQALLFITLCRAAGVPARWQSGWVTRPGRGGWNLHDWAEFYVEPYGWIPADPSLGGRFRDAEDEDLRLFFFSNIDGYRMIANTDYETGFTPLKKHWRSDPIDNQRGEVEWDGENLYYDKWSYDVDIEIEHLDAGAGPGA